MTVEPRDAQEQRHACEPEPAAAAASLRESSIPARCLCPTSSPSAPPALFGSADPSQCRVARPQLVSSVRTNPAARSSVPRRERDVRQRLIGVHQPTRIRQHHGKQVGRPAEQKQEKAGKPGAHRTDPIAHRTGLAGVRKAGIPRMIGQKREQQQQRERAQNPKRTLAQRPRDGCGELYVRFWLLERSGVSQSPDL